MKVLWTEDPRKDLEDIYLFLLQKSENAAVEIYNDIYDDVGKLAMFPQLGAIETLLEDCPKSYRSLIVRKTYKIVYIIDDTTIYVIAIWDCRKNPSKLQEQVEK